MKITIDIPESQFELAAQRYLENLSWLRAPMERAAHDEAATYVERLGIQAIVRKYIDERLAAILEDVVTRQVRHVVKLAVDREFAVARESVTP